MALVPTRARRRRAWQLKSWIKIKTTSTCPRPHVCFLNNKINNNCGLLTKFDCFCERTTTHWKFEHAGLIPAFIMPTYELAFLMKNMARVSLFWFKFSCLRLNYWQSACIVSATGWFCSFIYLLRFQFQPEIAVSLKRTAQEIFNRGGFIRKIENLGVSRDTPYKISAHGQVHRSARYDFLPCSK